MRPEEQQARQEAGPTYALAEFFVFAEHDLLPKYVLRRKDGTDPVTRFYMIDFRNTFKVRCTRVPNNKQAPLENVLLQLSDKTRAELRDKLAHFYGRVPNEN